MQNIQSFKNFLNVPRIDESLEPRFNRGKEDRPGIGGEPYGKRKEKEKSRMRGIKIKKH